MQPSFVYLLDAPPSRSPDPRARIAGLVMCLAACSSPQPASDLDAGTDAASVPDADAPPVTDEREAAVLQLGSPGIDQLVDVAIVGGVVSVVGSFSATLDLGGVATTSAGMSDGVIVGLAAPDLMHAWHRPVGGADNDRIASVAGDPTGAGSMIVTGFFNGAVDLGGANPTGASAHGIFLAKYAAGGSHVWSMQFASGREYVAGVVTDSHGDIFVGGYFFSPTQIGGQTFTSAGSSDMFVAKCSGANGAVIWARHFGSTGTDIAGGLAVDGAGDVYFVGTNEGALDLGGGPMVFAGLQDGFVVKLDGDNGAHVWSRGFGGAGITEPDSVAVDGAGHVVITGYFEQSVNFGGGTRTSAGQTDMFVASYAANGTPIWSIAAGGPGVDRGYGIAADGTDAVLVAGAFQQTIDLGGGAMTSAGSYDVFVASYASATGAHRDSARYGGTMEDYSASIAVTSDGWRYITGAFRGAVDFGVRTLTSAGASDGFLLRLPPTTLSTY